MKLSPYKSISIGALWTYISWLPIIRGNTNPIIEFLSFPSDIGIFLEQYIHLRASYLPYAFLFSLIFCIGICLSLYKIITLFLVKQKHNSAKRSD